MIQGGSMKKSIFAAVAVTLTLGFGPQAISCDQHGFSGIVEDNSLWIAPNAFNSNGLTEEKFNSIIDRVEAIYAPIITAREKTLQVIRKWEDGTVNAYAQQTGNTWKVSMFGGLARHETITDDAFATVVCHELGHHLGGAPKKASWWGSAWASNEGQADYFAMTKCLRKYMETSDNISIMSKVVIPELVVEKCEKNFSNAEDIAMCQRGAMAGQSLANLFRALRRMTIELKFTTPDTAVVSKTNHNHPAPQCRMDTYFQGALCDKDHYLDVSRTDANKNVCSRSEESIDGIRPLCWYKPAN
jgi:hypothetical protein